MLVLYLRSRGVPAALVTLILMTAGIWALDSPAPELLLIAPAMGVAVTSVGLGGADVHLDRTGAVPWPLWRAVHLVVAGLVVFGLVAAVDLWDVSVVLRNAMGLAGLAGLAAAVLGNQLAWTLPALWAAVCVFGPRDSEILTWLSQRSDSTTAVVTASVIGTVGLAAYAFAGPRGTS
ncbi:hypothetical protein DMH04_15110 [Kibdelosporangium aridum]|uniref:Uncharacterized protein n=1 Tax=Kibdelosporangium aridum TaxID=2030 RepID=A0A428ZD72_KIBAR|nr:hypothetical protein [Kibdelosporangium aridum]RSM86001.1 hypothetical protein DMH04_15110 [Kibdelosporangium aridum]